MLRLIFSRLLQGVFVLLIISLLIFVLLAAAGGDAVTAVNNSRSSEETIAAIRHNRGLDPPLLERYGRWVAEAARGDLGYSLNFQASVWSLLWRPLLRTGVLAIFALLIAWFISLALGIAAARRAGSWVDRLCSWIILLAASTPR